MCNRLRINCVSLHCFAALSSHVAAKGRCRFCAVQKILFVMQGVSVGFFMVETRVRMTHMQVADIPDEAGAGEEPEKKGKGKKGKGTGECSVSARMLSSAVGGCVIHVLLIRRPHVRLAFLAASGCI